MADSVAPILEYSLQSLRAGQTEEIGDFCVMSILYAGGFGCTVWTKEIEESNAKLGMVTPQQPYGPVIFYLREVAERMPIEHVKALLKHEEGHVILRHVKAVSVDPEATTLQKPEDMVFVSTEIELQADDYASSIVGPDVMREAILSAIEASISVLVEELARKGRLLEKQTAMDAVLKDATIRARLSSLTAH